jgi:hypothetical protein
MLKLCGIEVLSYKSVFQWFKRFRQGYEDAENDPRIRWPSAAQNLETAANFMNWWTEIIE